jgi:hypothetical protein
LTSERLFGIMPYEHTFFKEAIPMAAATWEMQRVGQAPMAGHRQPAVHRPVRRGRRPRPASHGLAVRGRVARAAQARFRRRRIAVVAVVLLLAVAGWLVALLLALPLHSDARLAAAPPSEQVVVAPGDTIWDVARAHAPEGVDPLVYVAQVVEHNGVEATSLTTGMVLELPPG